MNPKIKDVLGWVAIAAIAIIAVVSLRFVGSYARSAPAAASFSASGEGRVTAIPDTAQFSFGVTTEGGKDIAALQKQNTDKAKAAIAYVKAQGIEDKDITTTGYDISPRYGYVNCAQSTGGIVPPRPCESSSIIGYTVSESVTVKARDFTKLGDLISGVAAKGANNVSGLTFTVHDKEAVENEARAKAVAQAKDKAEAFAKAGGFRLGRILSVQESGSVPPIYYAKNMVGLGAGAVAERAAAPDIQPGSQEIISNVTLTYEIE